MAGFLDQIQFEVLQPWIALVVAVILSLLLMATSDAPATDSARVHLTGVIQIFTRPFNLIPTILNLRSENLRLKQDNARLRIESGQAQEARLENERLRRMLDFKARSGLNLQSAKVIGKDPLPGVRSLLIGAGWGSGIGKNMAVINDRGLVGKIARAGSNTAVVQLLTDRNLGAAVRLANCRADGITLWAGGQKLMIEGVVSSVPVRLGEELVTSGLDGVFPAGVLVGTVIRTQRAEENLFLEIEIEPAVDFSAIEEVFVVRQGALRALP
jgi:rod shape-determining protein MreC